MSEVEGLHCTSTVPADSQVFIVIDDARTLMVQEISRGMLWKNNNHSEVFVQFDGFHNAIK
jgi:hypothetical protein